jgi:hypothetical protein
VSAELFEATKRWGRWGEDDERGALNLLTPERVGRAATLVREGVTVPCGRPLATAPAVDNPTPALHHMIHAGDLAVGAKGFDWSGDFVGVAFHGNSVSHVDALCHVFVDGQMYNGARMTAPTSCTRVSEPPARRTAAITAAESAGVQAVTVRAPMRGNTERPNR